MSVKTTNDDSIPRDDIPERFDVSNTSDGLTLHNPSNGVVIDVWKRNRGTLLDTYPYNVMVAQDQETKYERVTENMTNAVDAAIREAQKY